MAPQEQFFESKKVTETEEERKQREAEREQLKSEILGVHSGVEPKEPKSDLPNLKLSKEVEAKEEAAPEEGKGEEDVEGAEEEDEAEDVSEPEEQPDGSKRKKVETAEEANQSLREKTERLREVMSRQTIEFVPKPVYTRVSCRVHRML